MYQGAKRKSSRKSSVVLIKGVRKLTFINTYHREGKSPPTFFVSFLFFFFFFFFFFFAPDSVHSYSGSIIQQQQKLACSFTYCSVVSKSQQIFGLKPTKLLCPWDFSGKNNWNGMPFSPPRNLLNPRIESMFPTSQADSLSAEPTGKPGSLGESNI